MSSDRVFDQAATRYLASLTRLRSPYGHGLAVCRICRGPTTNKKDSPEHWEICWPCREHRTTPGIALGELAEEIGFIVYALEQKNGSPDQALRDMYQYKLLPPTKTARETIPEPGQRIRTLLYIFLRDNFTALARTVAPVEVITHVRFTSTRPNRDKQALADAVDSAVAHLPGSAPHRRLLAPAQTPPHRRGRSIPTASPSMSPRPWLGAMSWRWKTPG